MRAIANYEHFRYDVHCMQNSTTDSPSENIDENSVGHLRLAFVAERALLYNLNIPAKLMLVDQLAEMVACARKSYRENLPKA